MFDIGWSELLVIAIIAILVVGPKDLPRMLHALGQAMGKMRRQADDFRRQFNESMREAGMDDVQKGIRQATDMNPARQVKSQIESAFDIGGMGPAPKGPEGKGSEGKASEGPASEGQSSEGNAAESTAATKPTAPAPSLSKPAAPDQVIAGPPALEPVQDHSAAPDVAAPGSAENLQSTAEAGSHSHEPGQAATRGAAPEAPRGDASAGPKSAAG